MTQQYYRVTVSVLIAADNEDNAEEVAINAMAAAEDMGAVIEYCIDDVEDDDGPDD